MKKLSLIALACLMVLGLAQCKKNEPTNNNTADNGNRVSITLTLDKGGQRVHPEEENGLANVVYDNGDMVYVGSNGKYRGYLTYNGDSHLFAGSISTAATEGQPLQFVFMGGQNFHANLTENITTEYLFNISDQSNGIAVISCAASNENFSATKLDYTATLRNKCALVKFDLGKVSADAAITLTGVKTQATIGFDGTVTNGTTTGDIVTYGTGSTRYAVVLSDQAAVTNGTISAEGYEGTFSIPSAAYTNGFLTDATMTLTATSSVPTGAINGKFTINSNNGQVYFSQGNLQYIGSAATPYWKFANHQWDYLGDGQGVGVATANYDLFGWGTSGYDHGAACYQPWSWDNNSFKYYAYGEYNKDLFNESGKADWGYNAISNGGGEEHKWRTLSRPEWVYILDTRATSTGIRYAKAKVNDVNGVILLPDDWSSETYTLNSTNVKDASFSSNTISASQWNTLEQAGAVFLPAAGKRKFTDHTSFHDVGSKGYYWSASHEDKYGAKCMYFEESNLQSYVIYERCHGQSVRLVRPVEN